jgi:major membrane immunogen (membrane-anchored lipoprotein)
MKRLAAVVATVMLLAACSSSGWSDETKQEYLGITNDMTATLNAAAANPAGWQEYCLKLAGLAGDGLDLPDGPSAEFDTAWDRAMDAYAAADDGDITQCTAAMNVATGYITEATTLLDEEN